MSSTSSPPFPLFRLPHVAISVVFNLTTPDDIIIISFCSKKTIRIIKYTSIKWKRRKELELAFHGSQPAVIYEEFSLLSVSNISEAKDLKHLKNLKIGESIVPVDTSKMVTYWKDKLKGIRSVMEYAMEIFNNEIYIFDLKNDMTSSEIHWLFQWMARRKTVFSQCFLDCNQVTTEDLNFFFRNIKFDGVVNIEKAITKTYRYQRNSFWTFPKLCIYIYDGLWMRLKCLLSMNCIGITLGDTSFTSQDINIFLKKWQTGEAWSRLKSGAFVLYNVDLKKIIEGLNGTEVSEDINREYRMFPDKTIKFSGGHDIKRHDGVVASIWREISGGGPLTFFRVLVWPDIMSGVMSN